MALSPPSKLLHFKSHLRNAKSYLQIPPLQTGKQLFFPRFGQQSLLISYSHKGNLSTISHEPQRLSDRWQELHGQNYWAGLLDPMDPTLRSELIRYGDMAQACYDAFDSNTYSSTYGKCRYKSQEFFTSLGMENSGYDITQYLHATAKFNLPRFMEKSVRLRSENAFWIGYVAVSNDEKSATLGRRDIAIVWRGTQTKLEMFEDFKDVLCASDKISCPDPRVKIVSGFLDLYTDKNKGCRLSNNSPCEQVLTQVKSLIEKYPDEEMSITITGHSLGGALAILSGYEILATRKNVDNKGRAVPVCVYSFAGPRVGNVRFKESVEKVGLKVLRVVNVRDRVSKAPGLFLNEGLPPVVLKAVEWLPKCYSHVGVELALDDEVSPFLKRDRDLPTRHNLEAYLHLLDGYRGKGLEFKLSGERDLALVNRSCDFLMNDYSESLKDEYPFLKDDYKIPPNWKQDQDKGMVKDKDGHWIHP